MGEFTDKVVAIKGGGSGIGLSIAERFYGEGAKVAIFDKSPQNIEKANRMFKSGIVYQGDVTQLHELENFYQQVFQKFGKIDILVASAGIAKLKPIAEVDEAFFDETVNINYKGLFFSVQKSLPFINEGASVILISSAIGHITWPNHSIYASAKAAVRNLAQSLSAELIDWRIRVNSISPGFVDTPLFDEIKANTPEVIEVLKGMVPCKRFAKPEEVADLALFLASPRSSYIVGTDIIMDGGLSEIYPVKELQEKLMADLMV